MSAARVLLISNRPSHTGIGVYTLQLAAALRARGEPLDVRQWRGRVIEPLYQHVVRARLGSSLAGRALGTAEEGARLVSLLAFAATTPAGYGVYHIVSPSLALIARWRHPCVVTVHDTIPFEQPRDRWDALIRRSMRDVQRAAEVIVPTAAVRNALLRLVPLAGVPVTVIPHGVDHARFLPGDRAAAREALHLPRDGRLVLHVGSEEPRKNVECLLRAVAAVRASDPDVGLVRIGERTPRTRSLARSLGIDGATYWLGVSSDEDVALAYRAADVLALPSATEGFGLPIVEAMASGCPVVAAAFPAAAEVAGEAAVLVPPGDAPALAGAIARALDSTQAARLRAAGLAHAQAFRWERVAEQTAAVYRHAITAAGR